MYRFLLSSADKTSIGTFDQFRAPEESEVDADPFHQVFSKIPLGDQAVGRRGD